MSTSELYCKGARVWIPHPETVWEAAELVEDYEPKKKTLNVVTERQETKTLQIKIEDDLPHLRNPPLLIGKNDFTSLSYLHEPAVLHNLQVRYCQNEDIYTYCGIVLVAINPYFDLPIYDIDTINTYRGQTTRDLDPHIFAVAEEAYTKLERESRNQSIIVSGESGAGKTVSAKYAMRYFATVSGSSTEIEKKVLASSPIMEAIGNAKTTRNDNSSRFGKYIELQFNDQYHIIGASMRTYLLEKTRVVFQAPDERNYHVFYQLCAARNLFPQLYLEESTQFQYLIQGGAPSVDGIDELEAYEDTSNAFTVLGFSDSKKNEIFKVLASILHLGNVQFEDAIISRENEQDQEGCCIPNTDKSFEIFCKLLEIDHQEMRQWMCVRKIQSLHEVFHKPMSINNAAASRDALAKYIYSKLFSWIVEVINKALESDKERHKFIGVLDIYGFETFETNSFEQFCINYANEKLQQQFNLYVFKLEQQEYVNEGIEWKMIDFYDNQPCIDLIEAKLGILDLLDEECRMPKGSDGSWTEKLYSKCIKYSHFGKARFGTTSFTVAHFADKVAYESSGFLEKNRDTIVEEQISALKNSRNELVIALFVENSGNLKVPGATKLKVVSARRGPPTNQKQLKQTVGSQFRDSLNKLMSTLNATTPHYVRCIKPNDTKTAFGYDPTRTVQQLRACGVLETIRLSAAGYPSRWTYQEFFQRYRVLAHSKDINRDNMQITAKNVLGKYIKRVDMYHFGRTKIFFRAGQVAYLEKLRSDKLLKCCIVLQSAFKAFVWRKRYLRIRRSVCLIQRHARGYLARKKAEEIRRCRAAIVVQKYTRSYLQRKRFLQIRQTIVGIQRYGRGFLIRRWYMEIKYNEKATIIQKYIRGYLARKAYKARIRYVVVCQAAIRRFLARRLYKKLKIEARSIEHVKKLNKGLENKIISLQQRNDELSKQTSELKKYQQEAGDLKTKLTTFKAMEIEIKNLKNLLVEKNSSIEKLKADFKAEQEEKMDLINEQDRIRRETEALQKLWMEDTAKLRNELEDFKEMSRVNERGAERHLQQKIEEEKLLMLNEQDSDREAYQKLLENYNYLEQHCESLEKQLANQTKSPGHERNVSDCSSITDPNLPSAEAQEYHGYGSIKSNNNSSLTKRDVSPSNSQQSSVGSKPVVESRDRIGLVLQLQHKLAEVDRERERLQKRVDEIDMSPKMETAMNAARDAIKISELELLNSKLKSSVLELEHAINQGTGAESLRAVVQSLQDELGRRSAEIVELKAILASQTDNLKSMISSNSRMGNYINEDGELALAYETQKTINKQLELELQDEKATFKAYEKDYKLNIERLRRENEQHQQLLTGRLEDEQRTQNETFLEQEVTRIAAENLELLQKNHKLMEALKKLRKQEKFLARRLKETGADFDDDKDENLDILNSPPDGLGAAQRTRALSKSDKKYLGMFVFKRSDVNDIMRQLIYELKPRTAMALLPGLPAYIVFMCVRHTDYINDEEKVRELLSAVANYLKKTVRKKSDNIEVLGLWLANSIRLLHTMKQYSGEKPFQNENTPQQNKQSLKNFDLSEYRQVISDIAVWIYQALIHVLQEKIQPLIVPAILEHEEISGISGNKPISDLNKIIKDDNEQKPTIALVQELTNYYKILTFYAVDKEVVSQVFKQLFYFLCASSLNNLLLRRDFCNWSKGLQIRHNLSHFEMWTREKQLDENALKSTLQPIIQAAQLVQARKTEDDVATVCEMCSALNPLQICKILNLYTPIDEFEQRVSPTFIAKVQAKLKERPNYNEQQTLLIDIKYNFPARFPFNPSNICLEDVEIPEVLKLPMLQKI